MRIGVLTGGGDCPGLNAVIRAVTKVAVAPVRRRGDRHPQRLRGPDGRGAADPAARLGQRQRHPDAGAAPCWAPATRPTAARRGERRAGAGQRALARARRWWRSAATARWRSHGIAIAAAIAACPRRSTTTRYDATSDRGRDGDRARSERLQTTGQSHGRVMIVETRAATRLDRARGRPGRRRRRDPAARDRLLGRGGGGGLPRARAARPPQRDLHRRRRQTARRRDDGRAPRGRQPGPDPARRRGNALRTAAATAGQRYAPPCSAMCNAAARQPWFDRVLATSSGNEAAQLIMAASSTAWSRCSASGWPASRWPKSRTRSRQVPLDHPPPRTARQIGVSLGED